MEKVEKFLTLTRDIGLRGLFDEPAIEDLIYITMLDSFGALLSEVRDAKGRHVAQESFSRIRNIFLKEFHGSPIALLSTKSDEGRPDSRVISLI